MHTYVNKCEHISNDKQITNTRSASPTAMATSVSVCKVGLHWDSPKSPRVYSQAKLVPRGYQEAKRSAMNFNQQFDCSNSSVRIANASSSSASSYSSSSSSSVCSKKTIRVLDDNMSVRLQGRSACMMNKLSNMPTIN